MKINVVRSDAAAFETPLLAVELAEGDRELSGIPADIDARLNGQIKRLLERGDFRAKEGDTLVLYPPEGTLGAERVLLVGVGKRDRIDAERLRRAAATAVRAATGLRVTRLATTLHHRSLAASPLAPHDAARAAAEGAVLAGYRFDEMRSKPADDEPPTVAKELVPLAADDEEAADLREGARVGAALARGENLARTLGNRPGNVATPAHLADIALKIAADHGMTATILGPAELEEEGMHALLAVARGSDVEPRLIVLEHRGGAEGERPLALLGKGLTFDAGGISIKPAQGMEEMKFDMCGGAAVLGAMQAIGELQVPANVVAVVPSSENLLSGAAMKPGDIIDTHLGRTVEVINTDAEGRLILADGLSYLRRFEPAAVLDAATLTGACVIALGHHASAALGNDDALLEEVRAAGDRVGERVWPLPMYDEYREQLRSDYADLRNTGGRPAGTITAAWFLREFVGDFPWVHLDVAGTAHGDGKLPYRTKGASGVPARLFVEWILSRTA